MEREGGIRVYGEGKMCWEGEDVWGGRVGISKSKLQVTSTSH